jgi:hypothetical protein
MAKKKTKRKTRAKVHTVTVQATVQGSLNPFDLHGSWVVKKVKLHKPTKTIGVTVRKSKFIISSDSAGNFLEKTTNVAWNPSGPNRIALTEPPPTDPDRNQNLVLKGKVVLDGHTFELAVGSDDCGTTLKIQLLPFDMSRPEPGGSGSAGRGI